MFSLIGFSFWQDENTPTTLAISDPALSEFVRKIRPCFEGLYLWICLSNFVRIYHSGVTCLRIETIPYIRYFRAFLYLVLAPDWLSRAFSPQWSEWCFRLPVRQIFLLPTNIRTSSAKRTKFSQHLINSLPNSSSMIFNSKWLKGLPCSFPFINCV